MTVIIFIIIAITLVSLKEFYNSSDWQSETSEKKNNIIFKNRNKRYGAFKIRTEYSDTLMIILMTSVFIVTVLSVFSLKYRLYPLPNKTTIILDTTIFELELPPIEEIKTVKLPIRIKDSGSRGSEGTPSDAKVDPNPKPQQKSVSTIDQSDNSVQAGKSNKTSGENKDNTATSMKKSDNPFGSGGGSSRGSGSGVFGKDDGPYRGGGKGTSGSGEGTGSEERIRLNNINTSGIEFNQNCTIVLKLTINAEGRVIRTEVVTGKTTTIDQHIINQISELVKQQIRYNKKPGAEIEKIALTLNIKAT